MLLAVSVTGLGDDASPVRDRTWLLHALSLVRPLPVQWNSHVALVLCLLSRARVRREVTLLPCQVGQCPCHVLALDFLPDIGYVGWFRLSRHGYAGLGHPVHLPESRHGYAGASLLHTTDTQTTSTRKCRLEHVGYFRHKLKSAKHTTWSSQDPAHQHRFLTLHKRMPLGPATRRCLRLAPKDIFEKLVLRRNLCLCLNESEGLGVYL